MRTRIGKWQRRREQCLARRTAANRYDDFAVCSTRRAFTRTDIAGVMQLRAERRRFGPASFERQKITVAMHEHGIEACGGGNACGGLGRIGRALQHVAHRPQNRDATRVLEQCFELESEHAAPEWIKFDDQKIGLDPREQRACRRRPAASPCGIDGLVLIVAQILEACVGRNEAWQLFELGVAKRKLQGPAARGECDSVAARSGGGGDRGHAVCVA